MLINLLSHFVSTIYLHYFVLENCGFLLKTLKLTLASKTRSLTAMFVFVI